VKALQLPGGALTHFTRSRAGASALDSLAAILRGQVIRASRRMVRGGTSVVCLFDLRLEELKELLKPANRRRYQPCGLAIDRRYAFMRGARPVIYLPAGEAQRLLAAQELWRAVSLDLARRPGVDWTFEREWRLPGDLVLCPSQTVVLVESWRDADEVYERFDGQPPCAGVIPLRGIFSAP
jgi:hypothetical protein